MVKVVTLFLVFIAILAMFGRLRMPKLKNPFGKAQLKSAKKCPKCGRYLVAGEPCTCGKT